MRVQIIYQRERTIRRRCNDDAALQYKYLSFEGRIKQHHHNCGADDI